LRRDVGLEQAWSRMQVVEADLSDESPAVPPIDVLFHVAGTVSFDARIDDAFRLHTRGVEALYRAALANGCEHIVHVSTAYVTAMRAGPIPEAPVGVTVDRRAEERAAEQLAERVEVASRSPRRLERFVEEARATVAAHGHQAVAEEAERSRREWVDEQLVLADRQRARSLGFSDIYTFTKALGEQVAEQVVADHRLSIVRPTIIESSLRHPYPGWIEGFKVADPLIVGLGRGDIPEFPGHPDSVVDVVPVDHVVNALLVAAAFPPPPGEPRYVTAGTGARNPLPLRRMYELLRAYFESHPLPGPDGDGHQLPTWGFPGPDRVERQLDLAVRLTAGASRLVRRSPVSGERIRRWGRDLDRQERRFRTLRRFHDLYAIYSVTEAVFLDDEAEALRQRLDGQDRADFGFSPERIDWHRYVTEIHGPAVTAVLRDEELMRRRPRPLPPQLTEAREGDTVLAVFDLDGTVANANVLTTYLRARWHDDRLAFARELADVLRTLPRYVALDAAGRERFLRSFYRRFEGADVAALDRLAMEALHDALLRDLNPAAVRRIREHRRVGHHTVLLTGALRSFCGPLDTLFDTVAAAELEVDARGLATGHLATPPLVGEGRARWLRTFGRQVGADLAASYAYADSRSDVPLLRTVGNPVVVNPDLSLHRLARRQRWPVVTWGSSTAPQVRSATDPTIPEPATSELPTSEPATLEPGEADRVTTGGR
jgi:alcohol-forming fatty acyl-CoA reductase